MASLQKPRGCKLILGPLLQSFPVLQSPLTLPIRFLLAFLHMGSLITKNDLRSLRAALNSLPEKLDAVYSDAMKRIMAQRPDDSELALKTLCWINNALRPLTVMEIQNALAVMDGDKDLDEDGFPEQDRLLLLCAAIVTI